MAISTAGAEEEPLADSNEHAIVKPQLAMGWDINAFNGEPKNWLFVGANGTLPELDQNVLSQATTPSGPELSGCIDSYPDMLPFSFGRLEEKPTTAITVTKTRECHGAKLSVGYPAGTPTEEASCASDVAAGAMLVAVCAALEPSLKDPLVIASIVVGGLMAVGLVGCAWLAIRNGCSRSDPSEDDPRRPLLENASTNTGPGMV